MPSSLTHAIVAVAGGSAVAPRPLLRPFLIIGSVCAVIPDLDAVGRPFYGVPGDLQFLGGHRAFTHSLFFAAILGVVVALGTLTRVQWRGLRIRLALFVVVVTASHGALDALSENAIRQGIQFLSPFSLERYVAPWRPLDGPNEFVLCLLPLLAITRFVWHVRGIPWPRRSDEAPVTLDLR
jgi:inner membrane protein